MAEHDDERETPDLRIVQGGREFCLGGVQVVIATEERQPFAVDARVVEEDTWEVLSTPGDQEVRTEHPIRVVSEAWSAEPLRPGTVRVDEDHPLQLVAIVYDLAEDPICEEEWIREALRGVVREAAVRELRAIALPPLGVEHGPVEHDRFVKLLGEELEDLSDAERGTLARIWLVRPAG